MAKDVKQAEPLPADVAAPAQPAAPSKGISRLYIILGLVSLILLQTLLLFFLLPSPSQVAANVQKSHQTVIDQQPDPQYTAPAIPKDETEKVKKIERPFGAKFQVQDTNPTNPSKMDGFIGTFIAIIRESDAKEYDKIYAEKENRIRFIIQTILRESSLEDRTNPHLNVIRGKIVRQVNTELGVPYVQDVVCPDAKTESM